jgi:hypothetical protein
MKPILDFSVPTALKNPKSVLVKVRQRQTLIKTDFIPKHKEAAPLCESKTKN